MVKIESFVFLDLETTGLPALEENKTKITELCLLAVSRSDIERATIGAEVCSQKLTLLLDPQREIQRKAVEITGLTNDFLRNAPTFDQMIDVILMFLDKLPKPLCLVAHNGDSFDFKILLAEFADAGAAELPTYLLCVDSMKGFKCILDGCSVASFALPALYRRILGDDMENAHRAESDCKALLHCVVADKRFVEWADDNCKNLCSIQPLVRAV